VVAEAVELQASALTKAKASEISNFRFEISDWRNGEFHILRGLTWAGALLVLQSRSDRPDAPTTEEAKPKATPGR